MFRSLRLAFAAALVLALAPLPTPGRAQEPEAEPPAAVYCGSALAFRFRARHAGLSPAERAERAIDVLNRYLGGKYGKFALAPPAPGSQVLRLTLNGDLLAHVTPEDAAAERVKSPKLLGERWVRQLSAAFDASKAQP